MRNRPWLFGSMNTRSPMRFPIWISFRRLGAWATIALALPGAVAGAAERGALLGFTPLGEQSQKSLDLTKVSMKANALIPSRNAVSFFRIEYATVGARGEPAQASGLVIAPQAIPGAAPLPVLSYQHGTTFDGRAVPSSSSAHPEAIAAAAAFGSMGYFVCATDYVGQGTHTGAHPYVIASAEASAGADMLAAAREFAAERGIPLSSRVFLTGYSEGGHATMALHRYLESLPAGGPDQVAASVPMAGPYDLSGTMLDQGLVAVSPAWSASVADLVMAMRLTYGAFPALDQVFNAPYASSVPVLLDGMHPNDAVVGGLPATLRELLAPAFLQKVVTDPNAEFRRHLRENDVYDWKPRAPVRLVHARDDMRVPFGNSQVAYRKLLANGAAVTLLDLGPHLDHGPEYIPAMVQSFLFIDHLR